ncbi:DUF1643 domain-containing protein [Caldimonas brevitalea]|uniref:DUF1643 domain-containing protein n=1 Tax=Caldimonas brevitalea TaxID=413882 RepID=A0A0G3BH23_9BURK|nr:DUF1643 domain-containing protein [Caldimonas brevitalea]AKJ28749.1 hypothetical protein AAW51_2058 [Caldimonas brevitalea]
MANIQRTAMLSDCSRYRYRLGRRWGDGQPLAFVMLNPSTADGTEDDPTIRKCIGFATRLGYNAIEVVNLFAFRATDPCDLRAAGYPVGPDNNGHIESACRWAPMVICAWGANAKGLQRPVDVLRMLAAWGCEPMALRVAAGGIPAHPLMLPYSCSPVPF